jgi:hypothetical protein
MLDSSIELLLCPRDSETLVGATRYHFQAGGFSTSEDALQAGEKLRTALRVLTNLLGVPLVIPTTDAETTSVSARAKDRVRELGGELIGGRSGLSVLADDQLELVVSGTGDVVPSDPTYVLKALRTVWELGLQVDEVSLRALEILSLATTSASPATRFLTTYLAVEQLVPTAAKSPRVFEVIDRLKDHVRVADLSDLERSRLIGSLGSLQAGSFTAALRAYGECITAPHEIDGLAILDLISACITLRHEIAHNIARADDVRIERLSKALRQFALQIVWTRNGLPPLSIERPADSVRLNKMQIRVM